MKVSIGYVYKFGGGEVARGSASCGSAFHPLTLPTSALGIPLALSYFSLMGEIRVDSAALAQHHMPKNY